MNECLECSWLPWQHVDIMNTPSVAQLGTRSPSPTDPCTPPTPAPSPEGCTNSDGRSDWATDHSPMLFIHGHGRMVRHRSDGLSMSQVSVSDMDPSWSRSPAPNTLTDPCSRPTPTYLPAHPSQHTGRHSPLQLRQTGGIT